MHKIDASGIRLLDVQCMKQSTAVAVAVAVAVLGTDTVIIVINRDNRDLYKGTKI